MGCGCNKNKASGYVYTYPPNTTGPGGETTHEYRTEIEAKAAVIRWGGGTYVAK